MNIKLSDHFTYERLLRYVTPSIGMMIFMSIYYVVDGFFVANFLGKIPFAAVNLLTPAIVIPSSVAFMLSAGGAALVSKTLGEGKIRDANRYFSMLLYVVIGLGIILQVASFMVLPSFLRWMGAEEDLFANGMIYGGYSLASLVPFMLQIMFQALWSVAEKPNYGFYLTILSGLVNIIFDYIFIVKLNYGVEGAAWASVMGQVLGGFLPLLYFALPNQSLLQLVKTKIEWPVLIKSSLNGASEMLNSISASILGILYNVQLMGYIGADGVAAYGVILYANGIFESIFFGYGMGVAPVVGYHFGAQNYRELRNLLKKSLAIVAVASVFLTGVAYFQAGQITGYFVSKDVSLWNVTKKAFMIYALSFLLAGFNSFGSAFFTALNDGKVSGMITLVRVLIFQAGVVLILPILVGMQGIWWSVVIAEVLAFALVIWCLFRYQRKYNY